MQIRPPADTGWAAGWQTELNYESLLGTGKALVGAYLPVPRPVLNYWNNPLCVDGRFFPLNLICYVAVPGYLLFVFSGLRRNPVVGLVFSGCTLGLLAFFYAKYPGSARHHGFLFACFVVSAWLCGDATTQAGAAAANSARHPRWQQAFAASVTLLLSVHVVAAVIAATLDYR